MNNEKRTKEDDGEQHDNEMVFSDRDIGNWQKQGGAGASYSQIIAKVGAGAEAGA